MKEETEGEWWKWAMRVIINILKLDDLAQLFAMPFFPSLFTWFGKADNQRKPEGYKERREGWKKSEIQSSTKARVVTGP